MSAQDQRDTVCRTARRPGSLRPADRHDDAYGDAGVRSDDVGDLALYGRTERHDAPGPGQGIPAAYRPHRGGSFRRKPDRPRRHHRSEEHTSELQSLMRISYAVFGLKKKKK